MLAGEVAPVASTLLVTSTLPANVDPPATERVPADAMPPVPVVRMWPGPLVMMLPVPLVLISPDTVVKPASPVMVPVLRVLPATRRSAFTIASWLNVVSSANVVTPATLSVPAAFKELTDVAPATFKFWPTNVLNLMAAPPFV